VDGAPVSWAVVEQRLAYDDAGEPFLGSIAERDQGESESLPDHQLEHALEGERDDTDPAASALAGAMTAGRAVELVGLEPGQAPDWSQARDYLESLGIEEIEDDLLERTGVHPGRDRHAGWIDTVKARLRDDLASFRADVDGPHDQIEEWDFRGGRIFAALGDFDDDSSPSSGFGWMSRLVDAGILQAGGFYRVRKSLLLL